LTTDPLARLIGHERIYFSYNQFTVFDNAERDIGSHWTQHHHEQGFARRERIVSFVTMLEFGHALVSVRLGEYLARHDDQRVIAVPFRVDSGGVSIVGPEEPDSPRTISLSTGHYRLVAAQRVVQEDEEHMVFEEAVDLFFEPVSQPAKQSQIILADEGLHPPAVLLEHADAVEM
jgi:hypothetical protein